MACLLDRIREDGEQYDFRRPLGQVSARSSPGCRFHFLDLGEPFAGITLRRLLGDVVEDIDSPAILELGLVRDKVNHRLLGSTGADPPPA